MGEREKALELKLAKIYVPTHPSTRNGKPVKVPGYWRTVDSVADLTPDEQKAVGVRAEKTPSQKSKLLEEYESLGGDASGLDSDIGMEELEGLVERYREFDESPKSGPKVAELENKVRAAGKKRGDIPGTTLRDHLLRSVVSPLSRRSRSNLTLTSRPRRPPPAITRDGTRPSLNGMMSIKRVAH